MFFANLILFSTICWDFSSPSSASPLGASCTINEYSQVAKVVKSCTNIEVGNLNVPANETLDLNLQTGSSVTFRGTIRFGVANWGGPLMNIQGHKLNVIAFPDAKFDGQGTKYLDRKGSDGTEKPIFIKLNANEGEFYNLKLLDCPSRCASITGSNIFLNGWDFHFSEKSRNDVNINGYYVSGRNITIINSNVYNQNDCITLNRGSDMYFRNIYCNGGHGFNIAVGSDTKVFENNVVSNITYEDCVIDNSDVGIDIKIDGPGLIKNITFNHIEMRGVREFGVRVRQDSPADDEKTEGNVAIKDLNISHVRILMFGPQSTPVEVSCASGACSDWKWFDFLIQGSELPCSMNFKPSGFSC